MKIDPCYCTRGGEFLHSATFYYGLLRLSITAILRIGPGRPKFTDAILKKEGAHRHGIASSTC